MRYKGWNVKATLGRYANGRLAIRLVDATDGQPVATCTVNLPNQVLEDGEIFVKDYSENAGMMDFLEENGIAKRTGVEIGAGYVRVPVGRILA